ncbi:hypothetical protein [Shewanella sp. UCD-KL21]|uniref:hypothetical protein n=1 Tax=Shewanella sp. UCD-KL21 TaxID=1917164 RepID=UPI000970C82A|nr:hypothetical protein [Shewanella sp. UCD-KL21]
MKERYENNTFSSGAISRLNATVGFNGSFAPEGKPRSNTDYAKGYANASLLLIKTALKSQEFKHSVDYLVYPVCFNMRHSVELRLKKFWTDLELLSTKRTHRLTVYREAKFDAEPALKGYLEIFPKIDQVITHNINSLWVLIKEYAPIIDSRFDEVISILDSYVDDIANIDPTGQTFRYPASNDSQVHLANTPLINFVILKHRFEPLVEIFDFLESLIQEVKYEYGWTKQTNSLSYFDIINVCMLINSLSLNGEIKLHEYRDAVKASYPMSNREYGELLNIVGSNQYLSSIVRKEVGFEYLTIDSFMTFCNVVFEFWSLDSFKDYYNSEGDYSLEEIDVCTVMDDMLKERNAISRLIELLSENEILELFSIYDARHETFIFEIFKKVKKEIFSASKRDDFEITSFVGSYGIGHHIVTATIKMLYKMGYHTFFHDLASLYKLYDLPWCVELLKKEYLPYLNEYMWFNERLAELKCKVDDANGYLERHRKA